MIESKPLETQTKYVNFEFSLHNLSLSVRVSIMGEVPCAGGNDDDKFVSGNQECDDPEKSEEHDIEESSVVSP